MHVRVDHGLHVRRVQRVATVLVRTGDPVVVARLDVDEIGLEAVALEALERLAADA